MGNYVEEPDNFYPFLYNRRFYANFVYFYIEIMYKTHEKDH